MPEEIDVALAGGDLVIFAGAGVSAMEPSSLPGFRGLVSDIAGDLGQGGLLPDDKDEPLQFDVLMGELDELCGDVHARVSARIRATKRPNSYHADLLAIAASSGHMPRVVTTNFDRLFSYAAASAVHKIGTYIAPALPLGNDFAGLVHLHGVVDPSAEQRMVVTDRDFGRAYITEGWATQFLTRMFERYTVVFVGYSADDTVMRYLARSLPAGQHKRFAFVRDSDARLAASWLRLDVTPILYPSSKADPHSSLVAFLTRWRERVSMTPTEKYDLIQRVVQQGPDYLPLAPEELRWTLSDPECARHFRSMANPQFWVGALDDMGALDALFEPVEESELERWEWAQWAAQGVHAESELVSLFDVVTRHRGLLSRDLWIAIFFRLSQDYRPDTNSRRWVFTLAADQPARDPARLSLLLRTLAELDSTAAEALLHQLLFPKSELQSFRGWLGLGDTIGPAISVTWLTSIVRSAWPVLSSRLDNPNQLLTQLLVLISQQEAVDALYSGSERQDALSMKRRRVDGVEAHIDDEPFALVIDMARDLLRDAVRNEGIGRAMAYIDDSSEMVRRLAVDALAEARSADSQFLLRLVSQRDLTFTPRFKPDAFRLMRKAYQRADRESKAEFVDYILNADPPLREVEVRPYERYNVLVWLSQDQPASDPAMEARQGIEHDNPTFGPRPYPDLDSWSSIGPAFVPAATPTGRFDGLGASAVVSALAGLGPFDDPFDGEQVIVDFRGHMSGLDVSGTHEVLRELCLQRDWSASAWCVAIEGVMSHKGQWKASRIADLVAQYAGRRSGLLGRLAYPISNPPIEDGEMPDLAERCRLLLMLWRLALPELDEAGVVDPVRAHTSTRGALAHAYVEATIRLTQQNGANDIAPEWLAGFAELLAARPSSAVDSGAMMVGRFASYILRFAPVWAVAHFLPRFARIPSDLEGRLFWAGLLTSVWMSPELREHTREAIRTGLRPVTEGLPSVLDNFIDEHSAQFAWHTPSNEFRWADAFLAAAPPASRARWIRAVAQRVDRDDAPPQDLLFAHWEHRLDGQPPLEAEEERALLDWVKLSNLDREKSSHLFAKGPLVDSGDSFGWDYTDLDELAEGPKECFLTVTLHLLRGRSSLPTFLNGLLGVLENYEAGDLGKQNWSELLRLGYAPARRRL